MCCWLCASGSISITARTDRKGYCPGRCVLVGCVQTEKVCPGPISITARTDRKGYCPGRFVVGCVPRVRSQSQLEQTEKVTVQVGVLLVVYLWSDLNHS